MHGLAGNQGRVGSDADRAVGGAFAIEQLAAFIVILSDLERGVKAKGDHVEIGGGREADNSRGREVVRRGIQFGVNHIAGNVEGGALSLRGGGKGCENQAGEGQEREFGWAEQPSRH